MFANIEALLRMKRVFHKMNPLQTYILLQNRMYWKNNGDYESLEVTPSDKIVYIQKMNIFLIAS